ALLGVGVLIAVLLGADVLRARVARRAGIDVKSITLGAFGPLLDVARHSRRNNPFAPAAPNSFDAAESAHTAGVLFTSKDASGVHSVVAPGGVGTTGKGPGSASLDDPAVAARLGRAGLLVTGVAGALLVVLGVVAPAGSSYELLGQVALWVGT
nr:hypothetical protein [Micromonospora sp. DSM 115978]